MIIYTDASLKGPILCLGVYNNTTGRAISRVIDKSETGFNNVVEGEAEAVNLAIRLFPEATEINTDSQRAVEIFNNMTPRPDDFYLEPLPQGCCVKHVRRGQNAIADWIAASHFEFDVDLPSDLANYFLPEEDFRKTEQYKREVQKREKSDENYFRLIESGSIEDVRTADKWVIARLMSDALQARKLRVTNKNRIDQMEVMKAKHKNMDKEIQRLLAQNKKLKEQIKNQ